MAKRKIITINEDLCNGCGDCITACSEGALALIDGKARLVKDQFCDGFGDCIGECPTGALRIEEREADEFDALATREYLQQEHGAEAVARFERAQALHEGHVGGPSRPAAALNALNVLPSRSAAPSAPAPREGGCPGSRISTPQRGAAPSKPTDSRGAPETVLPSELQQWPVQIHLVRPDAPYFRGREVAVLSTCSPVASADVHWRFIRGRSVLVGCPKLDHTEGYVEKLAAILSEPTIPRVLVVRMVVPCCGGLTQIVRQAVQLSGRDDLELEEVTVQLDGRVA